ncbi:hypothetical protein TRIP_E160087 [uncultured Spirochaetota bacterium]|nr:hypothetical protein TRIP_E160087 [uncultured Spirochaetota bacterium]
MGEARLRQGSIRPGEEYRDDRAFAWVREVGQDQKGRLAGSTLAPRPRPRSTSARSGAF